MFGYVRYFCPTDQATLIDWDKVNVSGAESVRNAGDHETLRSVLLDVFQPIAPDLRLAAAAVADHAASTDVPDDSVVFWQYQGVNLTDQPGPYMQRRVISGRQSGDHAPVFEPAIPPPPFTAAIGSGLVLRMPLAVPVDAKGRTAGAESAEFASLQSRLADLDLNTMSAGDWRIRVAGVIKVWNVFQHFHPYLDLIGVEWNEALRPALRRALHDETEEDYYQTVSELVAKTQDGHGYVYGRPDGRGGLPIRVNFVEEQLVVTGVADEAPFRKGDIIQSIDNVFARELLRERERYVSGSPHLRRLRALNQFGEGKLGSTAHVDILRDGSIIEIDFTRPRERRGFFFNGIVEFELPAFAEIRPGIFYVNLSGLGAAEFEEKLPQLASAKGVIFDSRPGGGGRRRSEKKRLEPHADIIPHLIDETIHASPMRVPQTTRPDRLGWAYRKTAWLVQPKAPRFQGRVVFINIPSVVSYGETCMAMIADYHLATLVGAPTAGCNGNVNFIPLPGSDFRVMWTGMDVRKHDDSPFYTTGFEPDFPVARTIRAVIDGRDEYLEKAIAVIEDAEPVSVETSAGSERSSSQ